MKEPRKKFEKTPSDMGNLIREHFGKDYSEVAEIMIDSFDVLLKLSLDKTENNPQEIASLLGAAVISQVLKGSSLAHIMKDTRNAYMFIFDFLRTVKNLPIENEIEYAVEKVRSLVEHAANGDCEHCRVEEEKKKEEVPKDMN